MESIKELVRHYGIADQDIDNLKKLGPVILEYKERLADEFYDYLLQIRETTLFLNDKPSVEIRKETLQKWLESLFCGTYDATYLEHLNRIGKVHVKIGLRGHYVNSAMTRVRLFCIEIIESSFSNATERLAMIRSLEKILDLNLDVMTSSFRDAELKTVTPLFKFEDALVTFTRKYVYGLNVLLVFGLFVIGLLTLGLFAYDLTYLFDGQYEKALLSSIGSLLILWVVIELLNTEIKHLKGGGFAIRVFVSVALVAVIRKVLIASLQHDDYNAQWPLIASIATLGVVYWLIYKTEKEPNQSDGR